MGGLEEGGGFLDGFEDAPAEGGDDEEPGEEEFH